MQTVAAAEGEKERSRERRTAWLPEARLVLSRMGGKARAVRHPHLLPYSPVAWKVWVVKEEHWVGST